MYVQVKLLRGYQEKLTYSIPAEMANQNLIGKIVKVPLKNLHELAVVLQMTENFEPTLLGKIKPIISIESLPQDDQFYEFCQKLTQYYCIDSSYPLKRIKQFLYQKELKSELLYIQEEKQNNNIQLTEEQQNIISSISPSLGADIYNPILIHGVTGSGKTEIYKKLIEKTVNLKKSVLFLLPEVSLALQFFHILKKGLPENCKIYSCHSATSAKEKKELWKNLKENLPIIIIGVHIPILLPIAQLGLIIIDEEHETGYQEKKHPKINTKEAALLRAQICKIPIVFGSATPSIQSLYNVQKRDWKFFELKKRFAGEFPQVKVVKLDSREKRKNFWISKELQQEIENKILKKEQIIIFLNRRGFSFFVQCKNCSYVFCCQNCAVSLTLHENGKLICHYCNFTEYCPENCPKCKSKSLLKKGLGTQQLVSILKNLFPQSMIERADLDTTVNKKNWQKIIQDFKDGKIDILVGTQTITKGYHFENVTLVGVIWADINLNMPSYNSAEVTLQQLIQVSGRAGRQKKSSNVIIQTMIDHEIYKYTNEVDYLKFYDFEIQKRKLVNYPPIIRLAEIEMRHEQENILETEASEIADRFIELVQKNNLNVQILGPCPGLISKIKNINIRKIYIKSGDLKSIKFLYENIDQENYKSSIFYTPNPLNS
ncbi:primosomal protein N' [Candidatus Dependentiae bacterium]|nr:primosomal protein N' [Candidatus Dependentiae bacterium]